MFAGEEQKAVDQAFPGQFKNFFPIGRGSYAKVFKAENESGQLVAIKVIDIKNMQNEIIPYMENEIKLLAESNNRNVIKLFQHSRANEKLILVLEYCFLDVEFMVKRYFKGKLPPDLVIIILRQLANGLSYLHRQNIIHRDLKLENFAVQLTKEEQQMLTDHNDTTVFERATYKLIDLGLAKKLGEINKYTSTWAGTELNMAPEILLEQDYSFEADMYSLGVCMYHMLVGKYPYFDPTNRQKIQDMIQRENVDLSSITHPELKQLVFQMLRFDPKDRLSWKQLYEHQYFQFQPEGLINPIDLELTNNVGLYSQKQEFVHQKSEFVFEVERKSDFQIQQEEPQRFEDFQDFSMQQIDNNNKKVISQVYDPKKKENDQIMQLYHIRNQCTLIKKLAEYIDAIVSVAKDTKLSFFSMKGRFGMYSEYLYMVCKQLYLKLKQRFLFYQPTLNHFETFQMLQQVVVQELAPKLDKIQIRQGSSDGVFAWMSKSILKQIQCEPHDSINFNKQYEEINIEIYKELMKMYQDTFYKFDKEVNAQVNRVKCLLCLAMVYTARSRVLFQVELQNIDYKQEELLLNKARDEPDMLLDRVTTILAQYNLKYD